MDPFISRLPGISFDTLGRRSCVSCAPCNAAWSLNTPERAHDPCPGCPRCTGEQLCARVRKILWLLRLSVLLMSRASWITVTLDITDGQVFIFETQGTAPLISEPLIWVSPRQMKVRREIWILTIPVWENQEKEFPAESGRGSSVVLVPTRRKGQSHQFPKGPAFTMTSTDLETRASLLLNRALFLAPYPVS